MNEKKLDIAITILEVTIGHYLGLIPMDTTSETPVAILAFIPLPSVSNTIVDHIS